MTVEDTHGCLVVVWLSEGLYWQNEGNFNNVLLLEGKFCRFDGIDIRLYRDGICREKKKKIIASLLSRRFLVGSSFDPLKYHYLLFSSKIVRQTFILNEYTIFIIYRF